MGFIILFLNLPLHDLGSNSWSINTHSICCSDPLWTRNDKISQLSPYVDWLIEVLILPYCSQSQNFWGLVWPRLTTPSQTLSVLQFTLLRIPGPYFTKNKAGCFAFPLKTIVSTFTFLKNFLGYRNCFKSEFYVCLVGWWATVLGTGAFVYDFY